MSLGKDWSFGVLKPMTDDIRKAMKISAKRMSEAATQSFEKVGKDTKKLSIFGPKFAKGIKKAAPYANIVLDMVGIFLQILDALGVLEPLMTLFNGVLQMIGGTVMQTLAPAIQKLAEVLFGEEAMELWKLLGVLIGTVLMVALNTFATVLKSLLPILKPLILILGVNFIFQIMLLIKAIGFLILHAFVPLLMIIYTFGNVIAGIIQLLSPLTGVGGTAMMDWANIMLPIIGGLLLGMGEIVAMQHGGIVTRPTLALIGEVPEAVIPLDKEGTISGMGGGNEELLWATEDNGEKLDMLINITRSQQRLIG